MGGKPNPRPNPDDEYLKICHYCGAEIRGHDYVSRFTAWGWHLRGMHFPNWGKRHE